MNGEIFLLLFVIYGGTFYFGKLLQKIRIPWIFAALIIGTILSLNSGWFNTSLHSSSFEILSELGILFLLFIIGFSIDLGEIKKQGAFIFRSTVAIILGEAMVGTLLMHGFFEISWPVSLLVASSFATVGEAVLLPILDEFGLTKKKLGQTILSIGVIDDILEIIIILILSIAIGSQSDASFNVLVNHVGLAVLLIASPWIINRTGFIKHSWAYAKTEHLFVGTMMFFSLFVWLGSIINAPEFAAIIAGIVINFSLPNDQIKIFESEIKTMAYGFFAPIFFVSVGTETDFSGFGSIALIILAITLGTSLTKIALTYFSTRRRLGDKASIVAGIALTVRLSTSIVVIKLLLDHEIIPSNVYTVLVGTTIIFKFINPPLLSYLIRKWSLAQ